MTRPTYVYIDQNALLHNLNCLKTWAAGRRLVAMVKANAYGCGLPAVIPVLKGRVYAFGVACLEEALAVRALAPDASCLLAEGFFSPDELPLIDAAGFEVVIHQVYQLEALLRTPLNNPLKVWIKLDTGMHRLGFRTDALQGILRALKACPWVLPDIGLMSHFASADEPACETNAEQVALFEKICCESDLSDLSFCNSAASIRQPPVMGNVVRPGIMLYGVSPFAQETGLSLGLKPVMHFHAGVIAIQDYPAGTRIGYGGIWTAQRPSRIATIACGYGDGYPRHIVENTPVMIHHQQVPIVGRISMDMLTVDVTDLKNPAVIGSIAELWGEHISVEQIAQSAGTIAYELLCQVTQRPVRLSISD